MYSKVNTACLHGLDGIPVVVEADVSDGLPMFEMIGELSSSVREGNARIRTALKNNGFRLPPKRITVNLAPVDLRKEGNHFDLPIAAAVLAALGVIDAEKLKNMMIAGELGLGGEVRSIEGAMILAACAEKEKAECLIVPKANEKEAAAGSNIPVCGIRHIYELITCVNNPDDREYAELTSEEEEAEHYPDFSEIYGQQSAKRAAEIAAAGRHNLLLIGPPGAGKTMLASCIPGIMPPLDMRERLELSRIYSIRGMIPEGKALISNRPFRAPHHSVTVPSLTGGGMVPKPGELSLAHNGILFLDEIPEMRREAVEALRQPLEEKKVRISRIHGTYEFPADFCLTAAMNPCPCGYYPDRNRCQCTEWEVQRYRNRVSHPIMDRIDLKVYMGRIPYEILRAKQKKEETSAEIRERVAMAQEIQRQRFKNESFHYNSGITINKIEDYCGLTLEGEQLLKQAFENYSMSARGCHRTLRVARTIADLNGEADISVSDLKEALFYRNEISDGEEELI